MSDDNDVYTAAQAREWQDGYHERPNREVHPHGGIVQDPKVSRWMSIYEAMYDPEEADRPEKMPGEARNLAEMRLVREMEGTEVFRRAMRVGDTPTLKHFTGDTNQRSDISGIKAIGKVDKLVNGVAPVIVILGEMGAGKTDFSMLLAQRWSALQPEDRLVGTNIKSLQEKTRWVDDRGDLRDGWIASYGELMEWVKQDGDPIEHAQRPKLFIGDEFSSAASGRGKQGYETAMKMAPLVYKIRKYGGALIYIAHGPKSIHPMLWRVGTIVKKVSQKRAVVGDSIRSNQLADIQFELEGIPPTDWRFNTKEASDWSWRSHSEETEEMNEKDVVRRTAIWTAIRGKEMGMSNRDVAEFVPYSHEWVRSRWNEYDDEGKHTDALASVEAAIA